MSTGERPRYRVGRGKGIRGHPLRDRERIVSAPKQYWTGCAFVRLAGGSHAGISEIQLKYAQYDDAGAYLSDGMNDRIVPVTNTLARDRFCFGAAANEPRVAHVAPVIVVLYPAGVAFDITLRIGAPSLDNGSIWSGVITKQGGYRAQVAWDAAGGPTPFKVPDGYLCERDLAGHRRAIAGHSATLTNLPVLSREPGVRATLGSYLIENWASSPGGGQLVRAIQDCATINWVTRMRLNVARRVIGDWLAVFQLDRAKASASCRHHGHGRWRFAAGDVGDDRARGHVVGRTAPR